MWGYGVRSSTTHCSFVSETFHRHEVWMASIQRQPNSELAEVQGQLSQFLARIIPNSTGHLSPVAEGPGIWPEDLRLTWSPRNPYVLSVRVIFASKTSFHGEHTVCLLLPELARRLSEWEEFQRWKILAPAIPDALAFLWRNSDVVQWHAARESKDNFPPVEGVSCVS